jgi:DNA-binding beta-propeller fold protein YncE
MSLADKFGRVFSRKGLIILAGIVVLYAWWIYGLSTNPPGFYIDESCIAFNGYSIATTGAEEDGVKFPLYIHCYTQGWSQYMSAGQPYALALLYLFISPSVLSARIFAATLVFISILLLGLLARRISGRTSVGVIVGLSGMATPWLFEYSRLVMETFVLIFTIVLFLFLLYNAYRRERWRNSDVLILSVILAIITYSYATGRVIGPLFAAGLLIFAVNKQALLNVFKVWVLYALSMIPMIMVYLRDPLIISGRFLRATNLSKTNSIFENIGAVLSALYQDISLSFFVLQGDDLLRHHIPNAGMGEILVGTFALGLLGLVIILIRHRSSAWWRFIVFGAFVSMLPGAITFERHHSMRALAFPIFFLVLTVPAISWLMGLYEDAAVPSDVLPSRELFWRRGLLAALLLMTAVQAVVFQVRFLQNGVDSSRKAVFQESYPRVLERALQEDDRPIYLLDWGEPAYMNALWYGATWGVDRSNFVHLLDHQNPPQGALVLSAKGTCTECQVIYQDGYLLYRNQAPDLSGVTVPVPASAGQAPSVFSAGIGSEPGQLSRPRGIALDAKGDLYVCDSGNGRIQKFDQDGKFIIEFGKTGPAETVLADPNGVAVDSEDNVWVVDVGTHKLFKFSSDGIFQNAFEGADTGFYGPRDVAVGPNNHVYVVDQGRARIAMFDPATKTYPHVWGSAGPGEGQFQDVTGITSADDLVLVADQGNGRIQVFDAAGNFVRQWEIPSWSRAADEMPDVAFDPKTKVIYVSSSKANRILAFDLEGNPRPEFELQAQDVEKLNDPGSLAIAEVNKKRWLYVVNRGTSTVARFELTSPVKPAKK